MSLFNDESEDIMRRSVTCAALGLSIIVGGLLAAAPASAQFTTSLWQNLDGSKGAFFLGVSGGPHCSGNNCWINNGTQIIIWQRSQKDQFWIGTAPSTGFLENIEFNFSGQSMCLDVTGASTSQGADMVVQPCNGASNQTWQIVPASMYGAPFTSCYVFVNSRSSQVMGVAAGNMKNGTHVIQWPLFIGTSGQDVGWHKDQFWCPSP